MSAPHDPTPTPGAGEHEARVATGNAERVRLWICPDCGFGFDAMHTTERTGDYDCPECATVRLTARLAARDAEVARLRDALGRVVQVTDVGSRALGIAVDALTPRVIHPAAAPGAPPARTPEAP